MPHLIKVASSIQHQNNHLLRAVPRHGPIKLQENRLDLVKGHSNALSCCAGNAMAYQICLPRYPRYDSFAADRLVSVSDDTGFQIFSACFYKRNDECRHCEPFESFRPFEWCDRKGHPFFINDEEPITITCSASSLQPIEGCGTPNSDSSSSTSDEESLMPVLGACDCDDDVAVQLNLSFSMNCFGPSTIFPRVVTTRGERYYCITISLSSTQSKSSSMLSMT